MHRLWWSLVPCKNTYDCYLGSGCKLESTIHDHQKRCTSSQFSTWGTQDPAQIPHIMGALPHLPSKSRLGSLATVNSTYYRTLQIFPYVFIFPTWPLSSQKNKSHLIYLLTPSTLGNIKTINKYLLNKWLSGMIQYGSLLIPTSPWNISGKGLWLLPAIWTLGVFLYLKVWTQRGWAQDALALYPELFHSTSSSASWPSWSKLVSCIPPLTTWGSLLPWHRPSWKALCSFLPQGPRIWCSLCLGCSSLHSVVCVYGNFYFVYSRFTLLMYFF